MFIENFAGVALVEIIIGVIAAIVLTILICILVLPEKRRSELNPFFKWLHDQIQFKVLWIEKILKVLYVLETMLCVCVGFFLLFGPTFFLGLILIAAGIFVTRIIYEFILIQILILKNTRQINEKLSRRPKERLMGLDPNAPEQRYEDAVLSEASMEEFKGDPEYAPCYRFCSQCGTKYDANKGGCPRGCKA